MFIEISKALRAPLHTEFHVTVSSLKAMLAKDGYKDRQSPLPLPVTVFIDNKLQLMKTPAISREYFSI